MKLVVTEKNDAAAQIARLLSTSGRPKADKVYDTPIYRFNVNGEEWVTIGLRGHIMAPDFPPELKFSKSEGWYCLTSDGEHIHADLPDSLERPPYKVKRKPFLADGIDIKGWKVPSLPYLVWAPIEKLPAEKGIIRALKNLAKKADSIVIGTDFDREGELIGSDALRQMRQVAPNTPVSRARYSAFTKAEIDHAFNNLVELDQTCEVRMELLVLQMAKREGVTEALKAEDQMEWVAHMNSIRSRAEEIVLHELVYLEEAEDADT